MSNALLPKATPCESSGFGLDNLRDRVSYFSQESVVVRRTDGHFVVEVPTVDKAAATASVWDTKLQRA